MLRIECDNPELTKELARLASDVTKAGAWFHESLVLKALKGNFYFCSSLPADSREVLISVPEEAFVPYDGVNFSLEGEKIVITGGLETLDPKIRKRLESMVRIYNLTNKIEKYKTDSPRVVFQDDPEMLHKLVEARPNTGMAAKTLEILNGDKDQVVISSFFKTRNFKFAASSNKLIPFIDFVNHHTKALPFLRVRNEDGKLMMRLKNFQPVPGENQCFARYGKWDAHDTYLMFGFSAETPAFVRCVPMEIEIEGAGTLQINSKVSGFNRGVLPPEWKDLKEVFPQVKIYNKKKIGVSTLLIPTAEWPMALKRILGFVIFQMLPEEKDRVIQEKVGQAEFQILNQTMEHYQNLLKFFETRRDKYREIPAFREAVKMATIQIRGIEEYQKFNQDFAKSLKNEAETA